MTVRITRGERRFLVRLSMVYSFLYVWMPLGFSDQCRADDGQEEAGRPKLMVLYVVPNDGVDGPERRFVTEVMLAIDQYRVVPVRLQDPGFKGWSFEQQRKKLRELTDVYHAIYVIWVTYNATEPANVTGAATLFMCTLLPGRTFLRTVDVKSGPDAEKELAVAARELLEEIEFTVSPRIPSPPTPNKATAFKSYFDVMLSARGTFGIIGHEGPASLPGAGIGFNWWFARHLNLRMETALDFGPYKTTDGVTVSGITPSLALGMGYSKRWERGSLGPLIEFQESWTRLKMAASGSASQTYAWWHFRVAAGLSLGLFVKKSTITLDGTIGLSPVQETIQRRSDGAVELVTPLVDFRVSMSFLFSI